MHQIKTMTSFALGLALMLACAGALAQAPVAPEEPAKAGFLKAYKFRPNLYWGAGLGLTFMPQPKTLCPTQETCIGSLAGFGFEFHMGARPHYLLALDLQYNAFFFAEEKNAYSQATLQLLEAAVRVYVLAGATIEIYLTAGGGVAFFGDEYNVKTTGGGFKAGAGVELVPTPAFSVGLVALYRGNYLKAHQVPYTTTVDPRVPGSLLHSIDIMLNLQFRYVLVK